MDTKKMVKRGRLVVTVALCHTAHLLPIVLQFRVMELHAAVEEHLIFWEEKKSLKLDLLSVVMLLQFLGMEHQ